MLEQGNGYTTKRGALASRDTSPEYGCLNTVDRTDRDTGLDGVRSGIKEGGRITECGGHDWIDLRRHRGRVGRQRRTVVADNRADQRTDIAGRIGRADSD